MWDLAVPGNNDHDFYILPAQTGSRHAYDVVAGNTPVLVHNCGNEDEAVAAQAVAQDLQGLRGSATNDHGNADTHGTPALMGVRNLDTGAVSIRTGLMEPVKRLTVGRSGRRMHSPKVTGMQRRAYSTR